MLGIFGLPMSALKTCLASLATGITHIKVGDGHNSSLAGQYLADAEHRLLLGPGAGA